MRELKYPAIYKHFEDKFYATIGVSTYIEVDIFREMLKKDDDLVFFNLPNVYVSYTEAKRGFFAAKYRDRWYHFDVCKEDVVLYKSLEDGNGIYGRPIEIFLSEVDREKYPEVLQKYRFEEYRY